MKKEYVIKKKMYNKERKVENIVCMKKRRIEIDDKVMVVLVFVKTVCLQNEVLNRELYIYICVKEIVIVWIKP